MSLRFSSALVFVSSLVASFACSAGGGAGSTASPGSGNSTSSGSAGSGGAGVIVGENGGSGNTLNIAGSPPVKDPNDGRDLPVRQKVCDAAGKCTCLRLALLGTLASAATDSDSQAFVSWLNGNSDGTATLTNVPTKPTMDAAFLAQYDILLVANVNSWSFSADEKAAVQKWVTDTGGGIITLTGFDSTAGEPAASSQLISFSGISYGGGTLSAATAPASGESKPIYYKGGTVDMRTCLDWNGTAGGVQHSSPRITTPIQFTPQTGTMEKLTLGLDLVGAFIGWPVVAPPAATVVAKDPVTGGNMAVAYEYDGKGRIFAFGDEWVIFTNQWEQTGKPANQQADQYNKCYVPAAGNAAAYFHSVKSLYQTKQFWYDAINWVAPPNECNFVVVDPDVVVVK